ncbi:MAG TPA: hypothetical protein VK123_08410 [Candidatus Limnocylindrales bacterium]|nr:hypothetical protein [Candidatus Limnocylindrales bacterium]
MALLLLGGAAGAAPLCDRGALLAEAASPIVKIAQIAKPGGRPWSLLALVTDSTAGAPSVDKAAAAPDAAAPVPRPEEGGKRAGSRKALLFSLLLPGAGEMSLGEHGRATGFFIAEGAIWTHFVWFQVAGHLRRENYIDQAQLHAGVGVSSANDTYWKLIGQFQTSRGTGADAYEETLRREARDQFPADPAAQDEWVAERLPSGDRAWSWSSDEARTSYRLTRENSRRAYDRSKYSIAAAIANRLLSAIDTQIIRRKQSGGTRSERRGDGTPLLLLADTAPDGSGRLYLTRSF